MSNQKENRDTSYWYIGPICEYKLFRYFDGCSLFHGAITNTCKILWRQILNFHNVDDKLYFLWRYKLGHLDISFRTNFWQGVSENVILADFETRVQLGHIGKFQLSFSKWTISSLDGRLVYIYLWIIVWYIFNMLLLIKPSNRISIKLQKSSWEWCHAIPNIRLFILILFYPNVYIPCNSKYTSTSDKSTLCVCLFIFILFHLDVNIQMYSLMCCCRSLVRVCERIAEKFFGKLPRKFANSILIHN